jgi:uncharacterized protein YuzE
MSDNIEIHRAQHESIVAIMQALSDYQNTSMHVAQAKGDTSRAVSVRIDGDLEITLDRKGNITAVETLHDARANAAAALAYYRRLMDTVENVQRAIERKHEGSIKPWQPSS